ncbi:hypothetical protein SDC9_211532 [bioreactor metagenome]|uniref:Uncharacterized protein n=1 Tax=bioreactor metagenome TaxID=1076179 RepID=A0A645JK20_9ZZZZ
MYLFGFQRVVERTPRALFVLEFGGMQVNRIHLVNLVLLAHDGAVQVLHGFAHAERAACRHGRGFGPAVDLMEMVARVHALGIGDRLKQFGDFGEALLLGHVSPDQVTHVRHALSAVGGMQEFSGHSVFYRHFIHPP